MYECSHVEHTNAKCYSLYKELKKGGCIGVSLYVDAADEQDAIRIFLDYIPLASTSGTPSFGGKMIKSNNIHFPYDVLGNPINN